MWEVVSSIGMPKTCNFLPLPPVTTSTETTDPARRSFSQSRFKVRCSVIRVGIGATDLMLLLPVAVCLLSSSTCIRWMSCVRNLRSIHLSSASTRLKWSALCHSASCLGFMALRNLRTRVTTSEGRPDASLSLTKHKVPAQVDYLPAKLHKKPLESSAAPSRRFLATKVWLRTGLCHTRERLLPVLQCYCSAERGPPVSTVPLCL